MHSLEYGFGDKFIDIPNCAIVIPASDIKRAKLFSDPLPGQTKIIRVKDAQGRAVMEIPAGIKVDLRHLAVVTQNHHTLLHVYHLWLGGGWEAILNEHIDALVLSGLLAQIRHVFVGFVGEPQHIKQAKAIFSERNIPFIAVTCCAAGFEQETMCKIQKIIATQSDDTCVLYAHDKGAFDSSKGRQLWRRAMTQHNIFQWQECLKLLKGADAVGIHLLTYERYPRRYHKSAAPSFAGNFWWATVQHLKTLGSLRYDSRFDAEHWLGQRENEEIYGRVKMVNKQGAWPSY